MEDFIPAFEGTWSHQSFVVTPSPAELAAPPTSPVTAKKWAMGNLKLEDCKGMTATGTLTFATGAELHVDVRFTPGAGGAPAAFTGTGVGSGPLAGIEYELSGWAFPPAAGQPPEARGAIRSVRGAGPGLGGMPLGTVGTFVWVRAG